MDFFSDLFTKLPIYIIDAIISYLHSTPLWTLLIFAFLITFIENIFPPFPGDSLTLFTGSLIISGKVSYLALLLSATLGSLAGFYAMYLLGKVFQEKALDMNKIPFVSSKNIIAAERWFKKYGYFIIVVNRFIAAFRAGISFFAGMSKLDLKKSLALSSVSSLIWNAILIYLGWYFADNLDYIKKLITIYGNIAFPIVLLSLIIVYFYSKRK